MIIFLNKDDKNPVKGDYISLLVYRSDLTPVLSTLEIVFKLDLENLNKINDSELLYFSNDKIEYKIISKEYPTITDDSYINNSIRTVKVIAVLNKTYMLTQPLKLAISQENTSFVTVYRLSGVKSLFDKDIAIRRFCALKTQIPTYFIAKALQRASVTVILNDKNKISFIRLIDLFKQKEKDTVSEGATTEISSDFLKNHANATFYSAKSDGQIQMGKKNKSIAVFDMYSNAVELNQLARFLVRNRIYNTDLNLNFKAGDIIKVGNIKHVIITAVHGLMGGEYNSSSTRLYLGIMNLEGKK